MVRANFNIIKNFMISPSEMLGFCFAPMTISLRVCNDFGKFMVIIADYETLNHLPFNARDCRGL
jgi:hypothetical protein